MSGAALRSKPSISADGNDETVSYGFLLLPEFPIYALIPAIEALRIANQNRGRRLYHWLLISLDGRRVTAGNGMSLTVDAAIGDIAWLPTVFVCPGNHPLQYVSKRLLNWLRRLARPRHDAAFDCAPAWRDVGSGYC